jgi:hypothetical protein
VQLAPGEPIAINAARVVHVHPAGSLSLALQWGDGRQKGTACGPCRLDHAYESAGRYLLEATVESGGGAPVVAEAITVEVAAAPAPTSCVPGDLVPPMIGVNTGTRAITWEPIDGATNYNLYVKTVPDCDSLDLSEQATTSDPRWADVRSPFDISSFNRCHTCYYYGVTGANGACESAPVGGGFTLLPCGR